MKGTFQPKWKNADPQFNVSSIELLNDVRDKLTKSITLRLPLSTVNEKMLDEVDRITSEHQGKCRLIVQVLDETEKLAVTMPSRKLAISPTNDFFDTLAEAKIEFKLN